MNELILSFKNRTVRIFRVDVLWSYYLVTVCIGFSILTVLGIHGSSINQLVSDKSTIVIGNDRPIRSDEFLRSTPFELNRILYPNSSGVSILSESSFNEPGIGFYEVLRPERILLSALLSGPQLFAAFWWLPFLFLFIGIPLFLRVMKLPTKLIIPLTLVVAFSPSVVWWSNSIAGILGRIALGSGLILLSVQKKKSMKFSLGLAGSYLITGSFLDYAPWVVVALVFFMSVGLLEFFSREKNPAPTLIGILLGIIPLVFFVIEKFNIFSTLANTTYPGARRYDGGAVNVFNWAFSAPQQWALLNPDGILVSNQSELSLGFFIFLLPAIFLLVVGTKAKQNFIKLLIFSQVYLFLIAWTFVPIPKIGINPLELVSPERALTVSTTLAPLFFAILIAWTIVDVNIGSNLKSKVSNQSGVLGVILVMTLGFYLTYSAGLAMKNSVAPFSILMSTLMSLLVAVAIGCIVAGKRLLNIGVWVFACISFFLGVSVNPVVQGFDNIYDDEVSRVLATNDSKKAWASDSMFIDAMLTLNGKKQVSGQQLNGPAPDKWLILDPTEKYKDVWNSGASYLQIAFDQSNEPPIISRIGGDQILISINPCSEYAKNLKLGFIISTGRLPNSCLSRTSSPEPKYLGNAVWIYQVKSQNE
jgi:hypothetical protein